LPFYGYDPPSHQNGNGSPTKKFDILHVAHNWWRWREISKSLLPAIAPIRDHLGEICFLGSWWDAIPAGAVELNLETAFGLDCDLLRRMKIQVEPPVHYTKVVPVMSAARVNIMTQRPLFRRLKILTSKYFEIFSADTIPLVMLDPDHAAEVYGPAGRELALYGGIAERLLDAIERPEKYRQIVQQVRCHLAANHSYANRVQQLVTALRA
jgi:hypothetical protein